MQTVVYCRTTAKGMQSYFVEVNGESYFLFRSKYRVSNKEAFKPGMCLDKINDYSASAARSKSVRMTKDKLPAYLTFIEKEYGVVIYDNRARKKDLGNRCGYSRSKAKTYGKSQEDEYYMDPAMWEDNDMGGDDAA